MSHIKSNNDYTIALLIALSTSIACQNKGAESTSRSAITDPTSGTSAAKGGALPESVTVAGTLNVDITGVAGAQATAADKPVELVDGSGNVVGRGQAQPTGAFQVALKVGDIALTGESNQGSRLVTVRSLFLDGEKDQESAMGVARQVLIDASALSKNPTTAEFELQTGTHTARKVGAIVGKITLETGEDPVGIDVYIPGTTYIAKVDHNGIFMLGFLPPGTYVVRSDRTGYGSLEWQETKVKKNETTHLTPGLMHIATGPKVLTFELEDKSKIALQPSVNLRLKIGGATKFRISQLSDFRDTIFRPFDVAKDEILIPFLISGSDGKKQIYLEIADSEALSTKTNLDILLDTQPPIVPEWEVRSIEAKSGYSNNANPTLTLKGVCDDIEKLALMIGDAKPQPADFNKTCSNALAGVNITIPDKEGPLSLALWAIDGAGRVSVDSRPGTIIVDKTSPVLTVTPPSGVYNDSIEILATAGSDVDIFYTTDVSNPTTQSPKINGKILIFNGATVKMMAIDYAGNRSDVVTRIYTIDRDAPILGSITAQTTNGFVNVPTVGLTLSAQGASAVALAESKSALISATWGTYAVSKTYLLSNTVDGIKTIFAKFRDDAGNTIGASGDIFTNFTLDTASPTASQITLLTPESPTGDFNKLLLWTSSYSEAVTYEVEVYSDSTYTNLIRPTGTNKLQTTDTQIKVSPVLTTPATYYWRVRARDAAGNASGWVSSGTEKSFTLKILANAFQSRRTYAGKSNDGGGASGTYGNNYAGGGAAGNYATDSDRFFGKSLALLGNINGSANPRAEIAYSIMETTTLGSTTAAAGAMTNCSRCGAVEVRDIENNSVLGKISEQLDSSNLYGLKLVSCDLDGDGVDELVVSAPGTSQWVNNVNYHNQGSVYVYKYQNGSMTRIAQYQRDASDGATQYSGCTWSSGASCYQYGYAKYPMVFDNLPYGGDGPFFGWSLACERRSGGAHRLLVGEPGYYNSNSSNFTGRIVQLELSGSTLSATRSIVGQNAGNNAAFGSAVTYLANLAYPGCTSGTAGPVLAVGAPRKMINSRPLGSVELYDQSGGTWATSPCAIIDAQSTDPDSIGFGVTLANLGSIDTGGSADNTDKLAVGAPGLENLWCQSGGIVRIYGRGSSSALKSIDTTGSGCGGSGSYRRFGYKIGAVGNFSGGTKSDLAVTAPSATISNKWEAGALHIYRWQDLNDGDTGTSTTPYKTVTGSPENNFNFASDFLAIPALNSNLNASPEVVVINRPNYAAPMNTGGGYAGAGYGGAGGAAVGTPVGAIDEFATSKMKIGTPFKIVGNDTSEGLGRSLIALPVDVNGDSIKDLYISRPNGRCTGLMWGALTLYSGLDAKEFKSICAPSYGSDLGHEALYFPNSNTLAVSQKLADGKVNLYPIQSTSLLQITSLGIGAGANVATSFAIGLQQDSVTFSAVATDSMGNDYFVIGAPNVTNGGANAGQATTYRSMPLSISTDGCSPSGNPGSKFGTGVGMATYKMPGGGAGMMRKILIAGAPGATLTSGATDTKGIVYLYNTNNGCMFNNFVWKIEADDPVILTKLGGQKAKSGFGSYVLALTDLDGDDNGSSTVNYDVFLLVANTNLRFENSSSVIPEYFIFGIDLEGGTTPSITVLAYGTGPSGSMLGGFAKVLGDIDGGGADDIAIAAPNGIGTYGNTGQVQIISGESLLNSATSDKVMQVIFNPEKGVSNFGISIEYADMTGDGFKDFIIGADKYDNGSIQGAGAVYVFPLVSVQQ